MKNKDEADRWLKEAEGELETAKWDLKGKRYAAVCFWSQQAAEKALKSFLFAEGERVVYEHSVSGLLIRCAKANKEFEHLSEEGQSLDIFYIPTRYPNGLPFPSVPVNSFTEMNAKRALESSRKIIATVKKIKGL